MDIKELLNGVDVTYSRGRGKGGRRRWFIMPKHYCFNKARSVTGYDTKEMEEKVIEIVKKWYYPMIYYKIDGHTIGSNNERNALTEYYRVCAVEDKQIVFPVTLDTD